MDSVFEISCPGTRFRKWTQVDLVILPRWFYLWSLWQIQLRFLIPCQQTRLGQYTEYCSTSIWYVLWLQGTGVHVHWKICELKTWLRPTQIEDGLVKSCHVLVCEYGYRQVPDQFYNLKTSLMLLCMEKVGFQYQWSSCVSLQSNQQLYITICIMWSERIYIAPICGRW